MLGEPFHYRDERNAGASSAVHAAEPYDRALRAQWAAVPAVQHDLPARGRGGAGRCLDVADFDAARAGPASAYGLTGEPVASAQRVDDGSDRRPRPGRGRRAHRTRSGSPLHVSRGSSTPASVGTLRPEVAAGARRGRAASVQVGAVGSHDAASAVVAVPMRPASRRLHLVRHVGPRRPRARTPGDDRGRARRELHERGRRRRTRAVPAQRDGPLAAQRIDAAVGT